MKPLSFCDEFAEHMKNSLRKSDIITRIRYNQNFALITDTREEFLKYTNTLEKVPDLGYEAKSKRSTNSRIYFPRNRGGAESVKQ